MPFAYPFDHPHGDAPGTLLHVLGGKGAHLAEMSSALQLPVPPGFTITAAACRAVAETGTWPSGLAHEFADQVRRLEQATGRHFGDPADPLLVSVRSGAARSMPGMMCTVLDVGLSRASIEGLAESRGSRRFALDCYRRLVEGFGTVVLGVSRARFAALLAQARASAGPAGPDEGELGEEALEWLAAAYEAAVLAHTGEAFPADPAVQLRMAVEGVLGSWAGERAVAFREREGIPHELGTAVTVQAMVFGNLDGRSATGVASSRNPTSGAPGPHGDLIICAQGDDVVAGAHATSRLSEMRSLLPEADDELRGALDRLERHHRDVVEVEFTVEAGRLWLLQARPAARSGRAAVRVAVALATGRAPLMSRAEAVERVSPADVDALFLGRPDVGTAGPRIATGLAASPGVGTGRVCLSTAAVVATVDRGDPAVLVRVETSPDDVRGMQHAAAVLTSRGGLASHAAVVARGWGLPAVVGVAEMEVAADHVMVGGTRVDAGDWVTVDADAGQVLLGRAEATGAAPPPELETLLGWADDIRRSAGRGLAGAAASPEPDRARARLVAAQAVLRSRAALTPAAWR